MTMMPLPGQYGRSPMLARMLMDPRYSTAQTMVKGASDTSPTGWAGALSRGLQGAVGGFMTGKLYQEGQDAEAARVKTLSEALNAGRGGTDEYGAVIPPDRSRMAQILMGNRDTAEMGFGLTMADMQRQQQLADQKEMAGFNADLGIKTAERMIPVNAQGAAANQAATMPGQKELAEFQGRLQMAHAAFTADRSLANQMALQKAQQDFDAAQNQVKLGAAAGAKGFENANVLRDEYVAQTKDFRTVSDAYDKIVNTAPTGAGDMAMLYNFVKLLDPGSVVRESEFATAAASGSYGERIQGMVQRVMTGQRLPDSLRKDFLAEAKTAYDAHKRSQEAVESTYRNLSKRMNVDPENVIAPYTKIGEPASAPVAGGWGIRKLD